MIFLKNYSIKFSAIALIVCIAFVGTSCKKNDYPCPGLGQSNEADMSLFDENGQLKGKNKSGRINKDNGLINKKKPKRLQNKRKTRL